MKKHNSPTGQYAVNLEIDEVSRDKIEKIAQGIASVYAVEHVNDGKMHIPHLTLYLFAAPLKNEKKIINCIDDLFRKTRGWELIADTLNYSNDGWLVINFKNGNDIRKFHELVVNKINPHRENILRKKYRSLKALEKCSVKDKESLKKYGDRHAFGNFKAHTSVVKFKNLEDHNNIYDKYNNIVKGMRVRFKTFQLIRHVGPTKDGVRILYSKKLS